MVRAAVVVALVRDSNSANREAAGEAVGAAAADNTAIAIIVTTDVAAAISVAVADNAAEEAAEEAPAVGNSRHSAVSRDSARHSRRSFLMERHRAGSIRSAKAVSSADQQIVI